MALVEVLQLSYLFLLVSPERIEPENGRSDLGLLPSLPLPLSRCLFLVWFGFFYVYAYTVAVLMVMSHLVVAVNIGCSLQPTDLFIIIPKYSVAVFRPTTRGRQVSLLMIMSHHAVAGI